MSSTKGDVRLELLLGRPVRDPDGKKIGRVEEIRAEQQDGEWVVKEYLIGAGGLLVRLSAWRLAAELLKLLGVNVIRGGYIVPWDKMDLANTEEPVLTCDCAELSPISQRTDQQ